MWPAQKPLSLGLLNLENMVSPPSRGACEFPQITGRCACGCTHIHVYMCIRVCLWIGKGSVVLTRFSKDLYPPKARKCHLTLLVYLAAEKK